MSKKEVYAIEYNGEHFQSVFPSVESEKSQLHTTMLDAHDYFTKECKVKKEDIEFHLKLYLKQKIDKKMICQAGAILFEEDDDIEEQLRLIIIEYGMGREIGMLDHIEGVQTIETFEYVFTVKDFLEHIGFNDYKKNCIHSVQNLIDELQKIEDKTQPIFASNDGEIFDIIDVDIDALLDRVDINLTYKK